jgi:MSHA biogenesis protein MshP
MTVPADRFSGGHTLPCHRQRSLQRVLQPGFGLLPAIFVLVIGALLATTLVPLLGGGLQANAMLLGEQRARFAARAGTEWGRYRIAQTNACAAAVLNLGAAYGALAGFRVTVGCSSTLHNDGGTPRTAYVIDSFAQYASFGSADYLSSRTVETVVR